MTRFSRPSLCDKLTFDSIILNKKLFTSVHSQDDYYIGCHKRRPTLLKYSLTVTNNSIEVRQSSIIRVIEPSNAQSGTKAELTEAVTTVTYHHFTNIQQTLDRHSVSIHLQLSTQTNRRLKQCILRTVNNVVFQMKTMQFTTLNAMDKLIIFQRWRTDLTGGVGSFEVVGHLQKLAHHSFVFTWLPQQNMSNIRGLPGTGIPVLSHMDSHLSSICANLSSSLSETCAKSIDIRRAKPGVEVLILLT